MYKLQIILKLMLLSTLGAFAGWICGLTYWLHTFPDTHLPTVVYFRLDSIVCSLLPLSLIYLWGFRQQPHLLLISELCVITGPLWGYKLFPQCTTTTDTRLDYLFQRPWELDTAFQTACGAAIAAILLTTLVLLLFGPGDGKNWSVPGETDSGLSSQQSQAGSNH
jgi:hypothetical protein